jgi:hypothetical protein
MRLLPLVLSLLTIAAAPAPPPPQIAAHVKDGHFDPGDFGWTRGAFPGATTEQVADWKAIKAYVDHCDDSAPRDEATLAALGYHAPPDYWRHYADNVCSEASTASLTILDFKDWQGFARAWATALPVYRTYMFAVGRAVSTVPIDEGDLRDQLHVIVVPDQMLRAAISWGEGDAAAAPSLDPESRRVLVAMLWRPIVAQDHRNTAWLKALVAKQGWPTISQVGKLAANNAWLLVQHADDDPIFQLKILKLMEPLQAKGEIEGSNYAMLYDRVMLPLTGKQRYGSQFTCDDTGWHPLPLEDEAHVDQLRKSLGLTPIADYKAGMIAQYGAHCS